MARKKTGSTAVEPAVDESVAVDGAQIDEIESVNVADTEAVYEPNEVVNTPSEAVNTPSEAPPYTPIETPYEPRRGRNSPFAHENDFEQEPFRVGDRYVTVRKFLHRGVLINAGSVYEVKNLDGANALMVRIKGDGPATMELGRDRSMVNKVS